MTDPQKCLLERLAYSEIRGFYILSRINRRTLAALDQLGMLTERRTMSLKGWGAAVDLLKPRDAEIASQLATGNFRLSRRSGAMRPAQ